jgi:hypothetical protein
MARFGLLSARELRLVDALLRSGALADTPASVRPDRPADEAPGGRRRLQYLEDRVAMIEATKQQVGEFIHYGSISELLRIRAQPLGGDERRRS